MSSQAVNPESAISQQTEILPKTCPKQAVRDENGRILPGSTANPNGRPKIVRIRDAFEHILATEGADKYARVVTSIALKGKRAADKLAAVRDIRDTVEGRPVQAMLIGHVMDQSSVNLIAELLGKMNITPALTEGEE